MPLTDLRQIAPSDAAGYAKGTAAKIAEMKNLGP
jgi:hypothetical protein